MLDWSPTYMGEGWLNFPRNLGLCIFRDMYLPLLRSGCSLELSPNPFLGPGDKPFNQWYPHPSPHTHQPGSTQCEKGEVTVTKCPIHQAGTSAGEKRSMNTDGEGKHSLSSRVNSRVSSGSTPESFPCSPGSLQGLRGVQSFCSVPSSRNNSGNRVLHLFPARSIRSEQS